MHCLAIIWYALAIVWYALAMVCKGNGNGMHCLAIACYALVMVCIALQLYGMYWQWQWYGMACIDNGNGMHCLAIVWYALAMVLEMVCNGIDNGILCIGKILGICKRECSTMAMLCGTLSYIHVRIRDDEYSLVWSNNPILR
jgi:hypothetical protein